MSAAAGRTRTKRRAAPRAGERRAAAPAPGGSPERLGLILASAVVGLHVLLALAAFNPAAHTGGDNAGYVSLAHALLDTGRYTEAWDPAALPHTKYPPVFPALLALWMALGATTWTALKAVPFLFSALSVLFAYHWAAGRRGPVFGAGVALLVAVSSASIDASHWILSEPPFVAFTLLALWAFDRVSSLPAGGAVGRGSRGDPKGIPFFRGSGMWLAVGVGAAVLAYFTRSAGLPLLLAVAAWLAWERRWRALALSAAAAGLPIVLWWLRSSAVDNPTYLNEFWLLDPYDPALGRVGAADLIGRTGANLVGYVTRHVPGGIVGAQGGWVAALGVLLVSLALAGWGRRAWRAPGVAELFLPLYLGLILVWPQVWSGDRFALPLFAPLFFYAGEALVALFQRAGRAAVVGAALVGIFTLAAPAFGAWTRSVDTARVCRQATAVAGPFGCWGQGVNEFVRIALWSRTALPEGAAVLSRKPRVFYAVSGIQSRTFPFRLETEALLEEARASGARYVVLDQWDSQAMRFVGEAVARSPGSFCTVGGFDPRTGAAGTLLLGIRLDAPPSGAAPLDTGFSLERCPPEMLGDVSLPIPPYTSSEVPLLSSEPGPP